MRNLALTNVALITPFNLIEEATVLTSQGKVLAAGQRNAITIPEGFEEVSLDGLIIAPGFIDQHLHGGGGAAVMDASPESLLEIAKFHASHGTTAFLATTTSSSRDQLVAVAKAFAAFHAADYKAAQCLGLNLEGPYLSPRFPGVHLPNMLRLPSLEEIQTIDKISGNGVKMITMAPELAGALTVASALREMEIVCAIGHSNADFYTAKAAAMAGYNCVTHCFNQLRPFDHREPGILGVALLNSQLSIELIVDQVHLHQAAVEMVWRLKGPEGIILVSDAMAPTGEVDGIFQSNEGQLKLEDGRLTNEDGKLAGSVLTLERAVKNFMEDTNCELTEAIRMATYNPACLLGINKHKGSLYPGKDADLVVLTPGFEVVMTMVGGEIISGLITLD